ALAGLATKPQLAAILLLAVLLGAVRRGRWQVVWSFVGTMAVLCAIGWVGVPYWAAEMLGATRRDPPPALYFPWIGASWLLVLRSLGLRGWTLGVFYAAAAAPLVVATMLAAIDRTRPMRDAVALALIATFFVTPYARHYDYPVLLVPVLV